MKTTTQFGKFNSAEELLKSYLALEAEFTKKCQRLKEAEAALSALRESLEAEMKSAIASAEQSAVENYLRSVYEVRAPRIVSSSSLPAITPVKKPKNLQEAKELAERFLLGSV